MLKKMAIFAGAALAGIAVLGTASASASTHRPQESAT
jgi:uncharacterized protein DUF2613